jgi:carboxymethylenebutenolidase
MCFNLDSLPPIPPIAGAAISHRSLELDSADGNRFAAFFAGPDEPGDVGVVVLPDVRGLYRFYEELALRLAEVGHNAIAIDYFGRTAGVSKRDDDFDHNEHLPRMTAAETQADIATAVAFLRSPDGGSCGSIFTIGFCFGGRTSWLAASAGHGLDGAVGFYGNPGQVERFPGDGPILRAAMTKAPVLALQAGDDANISAETNAAYDQALSAAGVEHEIVTYPGAPHSFFDRSQEHFAEASADAWARTLAFIERLHSVSTVSASA